MPTQALDFDQVERFRELTLRLLGLRFEPGQRGTLSEALRHRLEATGRPADAYLSALESTPSRDEVRLLAQELTVNETYFFRHHEQFQAFREAVLPELVRMPGTQRRLRLLSAGCASGEEPYSLAIVLRETPELAGWDLGIRGVDLNTAVLERAARARYSTWSLRETPPDVQARCFSAQGRESVLQDRYRTLVTFQEQNLVTPDPLWQPGSFDVVFCRNVLMYFSPELAADVVQRLADSLIPGGYLFLGYAETLRGLSQEFHLRHTHGAFYYQRRLRGERPIGPPVTAPPFAVPTPLPLPAADDSWVDVIRHACDRVESLTSPAPAGPTKASASARASFDLSGVVDLLRQERFAEADACLARLPPEAAQDADVLLLRAVLHTHGGDLTAAERLCAHVLELDELSAGAHYLSALCREGAGDRGGAATHDRIASYLDPAFAMPRLHLGLLARRSGDQVAARQEFSEALALLQREDSSRLLLFSGGFGREALLGLCRAELAACGGAR